MAHYVVGVHDGHNSSAAIIKDGELIFALQEERPTGKKNFVGFPRTSIRACLDFAGIEPSDVSELAFAGFRQTPRRFRTLDQAAGARREASLLGILRRIFLWYPYYRLNANLGLSERLHYAQELGFKREQVRRYTHHLIHAATAYFGMREDPKTEYLVITLDGFGDLECGTVYIAKEGKLRQIASSPLTASIGSIYANTTGQMGFVPLEHEYKLMGMAPYASPQYSRRAADRFASLIEVDEENLSLRRRTWEPTICSPRRLRRMVAAERFDNVCAGLQTAFEEIVIRLVSAAIKKTGIRRVLCAGGAFMNVKANKRIMELPEVDYLGVAPSAGDESLAMGAAWYAFAQNGNEHAAEKIPPLDGIFVGTDVCENNAAEVVKASGHDYTRHDDIEAEVARLLAEGKPVARCKGRMEFGARALGNRSILADPQNLDIVRVINRMVKKRDFWMPFAPVVRKERMHDYFVNPKDMPNPYMMLSFPTKSNFRELIAAVHNADLSARAQVIEERHNPEYYRILKLFEEHTGRAVLLNTSFNLHGYPVVEGPKEAMFVFDNSGLEYLAVGQYLVHKKGAS